MTGQTGSRPSVCLLWHPKGRRSDSPCLLSCCAARPASRRFLHPIQVVNAKEAGAAGILGVIGVWHACLSHTCCLAERAAGALLAPWCRPAPVHLTWHASPAASVTSRGTPLMSSFAASIGLDCPVEIVNLQELQASGLQCACAFVHATKASV